MGEKSAAAALAAAVITALVMAGCSSAPPSAASIARRVPGCHPHPVSEVSAYAMREVTCSLPQQDVWVATFSSAPLARKWMSADTEGGSCVEGKGWAAEVFFWESPYARRELRIARMLGGREVSIGNCQ